MGGFNSLLVSVNHKLLITKTIDNQYQDYKN